MRRFIVAALALAVGPVIAACGASGTATRSASPTKTSPSTFAVAGALELTDDNMQDPSFDRIENNCNFDSVCSAPAGEPCAAGSAGYADIHAGAQVVVTDSTGKVVGIGTLASGETTRTANIWNVDGYPPCDFPFLVLGVPDSGNIYGIQIANRGIIQFTKDEASDVMVSLGN